MKLILETIELLDNELSVESLQSKINNGDFNDILAKYEFLIMTTSGVVKVKKNKEIVLNPVVDLSNYNNIDELDVKLNTKVDKGTIASISQLGMIKLYESGSGKNISGLVIDQQTGVTYVNTGNGITRSGDGKIIINAATDEEVAAGTEVYKPITPKTLNTALENIKSTYVKEGGDSNNYKSIISLTQEEYDTLDNKDENTLYLIPEE